MLGLRSGSEGNDLKGSNVQHKLEVGCGPSVAVRTQDNSLDNHCSLTSGPCFLRVRRGMVPEVNALSGLASAGPNIM